MYVQFLGTLVCDDNMNTQEMEDLLCIIKTQWNGKAVQLKKRGSSAVDYWWTQIQMCAP